MYSSDTDFTPFDVGAYAPSTTYISGTAVVKAAEKVAEQIRERAALMFAEMGDEVDHNEILLEDRKAIAPSGNSISMEEIVLHAARIRSDPNYGSCFACVPGCAAAFCSAIR